MVVVVCGECSVECALFMERLISHCRFVHDLFRHFGIRLFPMEKNDAGMTYTTL